MTMAFFKYVFAMRYHCMHADDKMHGDLFIGEILLNKKNDFYFSIGKEINKLFVYIFF